MLAEAEDRKEADACSQDHGEAGTAKGNGDMKMAESQVVYTKRGDREVGW